MVGIVAGEGSGDNVSMHYHRVNLTLIYAQIFEDATTTTEHKWRSESDYWKKCGWLDHLPPKKHQVDKKAKATAEGMTGEPEPCPVSICLQMVENFWHELLIYTLGSFIDPPVD